MTDERPVAAVGVFQDADIDWGAWPTTIPAVREFLKEADARGGPHGGWEFGPGVTFLVGENGSGKSTLIEGIAMAAGLPAEGGSNSGGTTTRASESPLGRWLRIIRGSLAPKTGFFLRAETMHGWYTWKESLDADPDPLFHEMSHGESFNALLDGKLNHPRWTTGLVLLDEPEAALSFESTLRWLAALDAMRTRGTQVICATCSRTDRSAWAAAGRCGDRAVTGTRPRNRRRGRTRARAAGPRVRTPAPARRMPSGARTTAVRS